MPKKVASTKAKKNTTKKKVSVKSKKQSNTSSCFLGIEEVRAKAYYLWLDKGCPEDSEMDNWLEAEQLQNN